MRILVVDGDREGAERTARALIHAGYVPFTAGSGAEALRIAAVERPDLALVDVDLPFFDGYVTAQAIRANPELREMEIVAVGGESGDREQAREAGFDGFVAKPVDPERLSGQLAGFLEVTGHALSDNAVSIWPERQRPVSSSRLDIRSELVRGEVRLTLNGELDTTTEPVLALWVRASLDNHPHSLLVDLRSAGPVGPNELRGLRELQATAAAYGSQLVIVHATERAVGAATEDRQA
jgi:CheY-like chemotaxis protein